MKVRRNLLILFGLALVLVLALALAAAQNARERLHSDQLASENSERLHRLVQATSSLIEAESSQRAFAMTGDTLFLEEHRMQRRSLRQALAGIGEDSLAADKAALLQELRGLVDEREASMDRLIALRQEHGIEAAVEFVATHEGKRLMDRIRELGDRLRSGERERLLERVTRSERESRVLLIQLAVIAGVMTALLLAAFLVTRRELLRSADMARVLENTSDEVSLINQLTSGLQSCMSRGDAQEVLQHYLRRLFPETHGALYLMRSSRNLLELASRWGTDDIDLATSLEPQDCWALRQGGLHLRRPDQGDLACRHHEAGADPRICVPLIAQSEIVGLMYFRLPALDDMRPLERLVNRLIPHISTGLAGILLREALHQQNIRDPLTNLFNRRYLEESMHREVLRAQRGDTGFSLVMLDIDHFKRFNDQYGHQAGDVLLRAFAGQLGHFFRGDDIVCRYGGEEFLVVLPGATLDQAVERAELFRQNLVAMKVSYQGERLPPVTASAGVASYPDSSNDWETVLHLADAALYQAKRAGRDRVVRADTLKPTSSSMTRDSEDTTG